MVGAMGRPLVTVEEAFVARGRGVLVDPRITLDGPSPGRAFDVALHRPDGTVVHTTAELEVAHVRGALAPYAMVRLPKLAVGDVPPGTRIETTDG